MTGFAGGSQIKLALIGMLLAASAWVAGPRDASAGAVIDSASEQTAVEQWRSSRVAELTGEHGWLNLVGLFWLENGDNSFGRSSSNRLALSHPALAGQAGKFV